MNLASVSKIEKLKCQHAEQTHFVLPALLQKLVGDFFLFFAGKFGKFSGKFGGNFLGFFLTHRTKAQKIRGNFRSIFRKKIRSSKKSFVQNSLCRRATLTFWTENVRTSMTVTGRPKGFSKTAHRKEVCAVIHKGPTPKLEKSASLTSCWGNPFPESRGERILFRPS